jgi:hypothetical protein
MPSGSDMEAFAAFLLLDFVTVDRSLQPRAIGHTVEIARVLGMEGAYANLVRQELRLGKRQYEKILAGETGEESD